MRVAVTGGTGLVGGAVLRRLAERGLDGWNMSRADVGDLGPDTDWRAALGGAEVVIHCAARVHQLHDTAADPLALFRRTNVEGTLRLARQAREAGARRLVFLSSIKVNGEGTAPCRPYRADDTPQPIDAYGTTKLEAERGLQAIAETTGLEVIVIRPPLVYGPGVRANMLRLLRWTARGIPLPLGSIHNARSLVAADNLADAVATAATHEAAANRTFLVSDQRDLSTPDLIRIIAAGLGRKPVLLPCPAALLEFGFGLLGKRDDIQRLTGSLTVDSTPLTADLGWRPIVSVEQGIARMVDWFRSQG
jgi:nucleoside-diphosphate-sugar epimerase